MQRLFFSLRIFPLIAIVLFVSACNPNTPNFTSSIVKCAAGVAEAGIAIWEAAEGDEEEEEDSTQVDLGEACAETLRGFRAGCQKAT